MSAMFAALMIAAHPDAQGLAAHAGAVSGSGIATPAEGHDQAADRLAALFAGIVAAGGGRDWPTMLAALPGVTWPTRPAGERRPAVRTGAITIGGFRLSVDLGGTVDQVRHVAIVTDMDVQSPAVAWPRVREALRRAGATVNELGIFCTDLIDRRTAEITLAGRTARITYEYERIGGEGNFQAIMKYEFDLGFGLDEVESVSGRHLAPSCSER